MFKYVCAQQEASFQITRMLFNLYANYLSKFDTFFKFKSQKLKLTTFREKFPSSVECLVLRQ